MNDNSAQWLWFVDDDLVHKFLAVDPDNPRLAKRASAHPALTQAVRLRLDGSPDRAIEQLRPALDAGDEDALLLAGQIRFELCRFEEAASTYGLLAERFPNHRMASFNQGLCLARLHRWPAAVDCLQRAAVRDPERMEVWFTLGVCLLNAGRAAGSDACFKQALKLHAEYVPALLGRAAALQLLADYHGALAIYERLLEAQPGREELLANALASAAALREPAKTAALAERLLKVKPGHPAALVALANAALEREDFGEAIRRSTELTETLPESFGNWYNLGVCYQRTAQFENAAAAFDRALLVEPDEPDALEGRARTLAALGRREEALGAWQALARSAPERAEAWFRAGLSLYELGRWGEAATAFEESLARKIDSPGPAAMNLGLSRWREGKLEAAVDALEGALAHDPGSASARAALVSIAIEQGEADGALRRLSQLAIDDPDITYNLALLCHREGRLPDAERLYRTVLERKPRCAEALLNLGNVRFSLGDRAGGGKLWREAIETKPELASQFLASWD